MSDRTTLLFALPDFRVLPPEIPLARRTERRRYRHGADAQQDARHAGGQDEEKGPQGTG